MRSIPLLIAFALAGCAPIPQRATIAPACSLYAPGCLQAYQPREIYPVVDERVLADHALCRAVPP
jgi:hypothetical protein